MFLFNVHELLSLVFLIYRGKGDGGWVFTSSFIFSIIFRLSNLKRFHHFDSNFYQLDLDIVFLLRHIRKITIVKFDDTNKNDNIHKSENSRYQMINIETCRPHPQAAALKLCRCLGFKNSMGLTNNYYH